jgi:hypothetical protein
MPDHYPSKDQRQNQECSEIKTVGVFSVLVLICGKPHSEKKDTIDDDRAH